MWVHYACFKRLLEGEEPKFTADVDLAAIAARLGDDDELTAPAALPDGVVSPAGFRGVLAK